MFFEKTEDSLLKAEMDFVFNKILITKMHKYKNKLTYCLLGFTLVSGPQLRKFGIFLICLCLIARTNSDFC